MERPGPYQRATIGNIGNACVPGETAVSLSLEEVYWKYARYVAWFATRLLGNPHDVEDLVQDVFIIAGEKLGELRDPLKVRHWLATITIRQATWRLRKRRLGAVLGLGGYAERELDTLVSTDASAEDRMLLHEVFRMVERLPTKVRLVWFLRYLESEKLEDIAGICGCSLSEAKRRLAKAEAFMEKVLGHG